MGDEVFAQDEESSEMSLRKVTHTFVRKSAPIVAVTLMSMAAPAVAEIPGSATPDATTNGLITLNTTEEHPRARVGRASWHGGTFDDHGVETDQTWGAPGKKRCTHAPGAGAVYAHVGLLSGGF